MLRIYFPQQWFDLSDPAVEDALYNSVMMRRFVGVLLLFMGWSKKPGAWAGMGRIIISAELLDSPHPVANVSSLTNSATLPGITPVRLSTASLSSFFQGCSA